MRRNLREPLAIITLALAAAGLAFLPAPNLALHALVVVPLALVLPGYALVTAAFAGRVLSLPERAVYSLGLNLAVSGLGGVVLHWTPWGLRVGTWAGFLAGVTALAAAVVALRGRGLRPDYEEERAPLPIGLSLQHGLALGLAATLVLGAVWVARTGAAQQRTAGFTQLWVLPAATGERSIVHLGVSNREAGAMSYRLQMEMAGAVVRDWPSLTLGRGETWETTARLSTTQAKGRQVEVLLYRSDAPSTVYRRVHLWLGNEEE